MFKTARIFSVIVVSVMILTSCSLFNSTGGLPSGSQLETIAAATVSVKLTQIAFDTLVAEVTQQAMPTATAAPTNTLAPTSTPLAPTPTPIPPTPTAIPIPCNSASFVTDVTIKDGTTMTAGETFVKTWRVTNIGSCSWTKDYVIYFVSGNSMSAPASVGFPNIVNPGNSVDLSVPMTVPSTIGDAGGNWMLKSSTGVVFGVGNGVPLSVKIKVTSVPALKDPNAVYDFVKNYCSAQWRTNAGFITCPSSGINYTNGSITRSYAPVLENGLTDDEGTVITVPAKGGDGMIQGQYPKMTIHTGDHFAATLLCSYKATKCSVTFELLYQVAGNPTITSLGTWNKVYDNTYVAANVDLSALDGKEIVFFLKVSSLGDSTDDYAQWMAARITHP